MSKLTIFKKRGSPEDIARRELSEARRDLAKAVDDSDAKNSAMDEMVAAKHRALDEHRERVASQLEKHGGRVERLKAASMREVIRQGIKAPVETVPMPVRLEVSQMQQLKLLAAMRGTTASAIIRQCIAAHLEEARLSDPNFERTARALPRT